MKRYDYIVVGAGIAGCSVAYFLTKNSKSVLLIDRNRDFTQSASSAAGGFLSPLLGKPNNFKSLVTKALNFSFNFYKDNFSKELINKGVLRIPKNTYDEAKFKEYLPYMDFSYTLKDSGCFFPIGSQVKTLEVCQKLAKNALLKFDYEVKNIELIDNFYLINKEFQASNLILTTGADTTLIGEKYFNIRAVWGQKIVAETSSCIDINYHKECSISTTTPLENSSKNRVTIGATHHRFNCDHSVCANCLKEPNMNSFKRLSSDNNSINIDTQILLKRANDIVPLKDVEVKEIKIGARASSADYFPLVGSLINSQKTLEEFPYIKKGTVVQSHRFTTYKNLYVLNGLGGRGFVLAPYLANLLVNALLFNEELPEELTTKRVFTRWAKKQK